MKKAIALVVAVLIIVCGVAPYGFGIRTEETLTTLVQLAEDVLDIPVYTTRYTRGWFSSTAETWLALPPDIADAFRTYAPFVLTHAARAEGLTIAHHILHGPFPLSLRPGGITSLLPVQTILTSSLVPGAPGVSRDGQPAPALPILQVYTTVFLHGAGQGHVVMPAFTFPPDAQPAANIVWDGLQGDVTVDAQGHHVTGTFRSPGLQVVREDKKFAVRDVTMRADVATEHRHESRSDTFVRVGSMALTPRTQAPAAWAITGAELRATTTTAAHGTLQAVADVQLETLRLSDAAYDSGTSHLELHRLDLPAVVRLLQEFRELQQDAPDLASVWLRLWLSGDLARLLSELARSSPECLLTRLSLHTPDGEIRARVQVRVDGNRLLAPGSPSQLLQTIDAEAEGEAPVAWVRATTIAQVRQALRARSKLAAWLPDSALDMLAATITDQQLRNLVAQEYLVLDGNLYKSKARYTQGQLLVQGKPVDLPALAP
jgi:uncharacterized protein YdgA (DUF945 family)